MFHLDWLGTQPEYLQGSIDKIAESGLKSAFQACKRAISFGSPTSYKMSETVVFSPLPKGVQAFSPGISEVQVTICV